MSEPLTISEAGAALRDGSTTSVALTLAGYALADRIDEKLGTYLHRFDEEALATAEQADRDLAAGRDRGPLHGIPLGVKDIIAVTGGPTTAQSLILDRAWGDQGDAPVVQRLRAAGAVITGKLTTMEYAIGMPDAEKPFPVPRNPWNLDHYPGGSSSGTGNGVAAGMFFGGLGTDTGGSIRGPAAFCGISGMKGTFGRVPKSGCVPLGYTLDNIGPMARSSLDCALMMNVLAGYDASDPTCADVPVGAYTAGLDGDLTGLRLAVDRVNSVDKAITDPACRVAFDAAIAELVAAGAVVEDIVLPLYDELEQASIAAMYSEAFAYHRRDLATRWHDYGRATRLAIASGALVSGPDYVQAQRVRDLARTQILDALRGFDAVLTPTAMTGAPLGTAALDDLVEIETTPVWNGVGFPALSVPMGFDDGGLPLSLQITTKPWAERTGFAIGHALQTRTDWHLRVPPIAV